LRTLPHLEAWDRAYRKDGLVIVGVHTPEFAFEHSLSNVRAATRRLGVRYPVALDNDYATWDAYSNQYWPAEYLLDRRAPLPLDPPAYGGTWLVGRERIMAGRDARLRLHFHAHDVYLVLGGRGVVRVLLDGRTAGTVRVTGDRLYTLVSGKKIHEGLLELRFSPAIGE